MQFSSRKWEKKNESKWSVENMKNKKHKNQKNKNNIVKWKLCNNDEKKTASDTIECDNNTLFDEKYLSRMGKKSSFKRSFYANIKVSLLHGTF